MNTILDIDGLVDCCEGFGDLCKSVRGEVREFVMVCLLVVVTLC